MNPSTQRTIVDLMTGLFGELFPQPAWRPWILCAAAVFGLTYGLDVDDQAFILQCLGRTRLPRTKAERVVLIIGRRGGKSRFASFLAVFLAVFVDYRGVLSVGERGTGMVIAPDRRQARTCFRYIAAFIDHEPMLAGMVTRRTRDSIDLRNGITLEVHTASFRSVRGFSVVFAIVDEAAFLPTDDSSEPDVELVAALLPAMATTGGMLILISSPYAKRGEIYRAVREHFGQDDDPVLVWKAESRTMHPGIPQTLVDQAYRDDPARAASEWGAEFRSDIESFLGPEAIAAVVVPGRRQVPRMAREYFAFVDPAGGGGPAADSFTAAIVHHDAKVGAVIVDAIFEKRPPMSPDAVTEELATWLKGFGVRQVTGDRYAGSWPADACRKHGISYVPAEKSKSELYLEFLPLVTSRRVELLDDPRLVAQLQALERRVGRGGRDSVDHPPGSHDDVANAVAGACVLVAHRVAVPTVCLAVIKLLGQETLQQEMARLRGEQAERDEANDHHEFTRLAADELTLARLRPLVEQYGADVVEEIRRLRDPDFTLPASLRATAPIGDGR